ncbi:MAG: T9SS type A sorting domain-containing protein [Flavobacteriales bacterium]
MVALNNAQYAPGTADFIVSQVDALVQGFTCKNGKGFFSGVSPSQIAVCLPASAQAGGGYFINSVVIAAMAYLRGEGPKPGSYTLVQNGGYPDLHGLATWSINMDLINSYSFANNYASIFTSCLTTSSEEVEAKDDLFAYPNPAVNDVTVNITHTQWVEMYDEMGKIVIGQWLHPNEKIDVSKISGGLYFLRVEGSTQKVLIRK